MKIKFLSNNAIIVHPQHSTHAYKSRSTALKKKKKPNMKSDKALALFIIYAVSFHPPLPGITARSLHKSVANLQWAHSSLSRNRRIPLSALVSQDKQINSEE